MTNQEYINEHPEKFTDDIDKWLFTEFSIVGGCCSAQGSMEYSVARMVAEKMKQQMIDKTVKWIKSNICYDENVDGNMEWVVMFMDVDEMVENFKKFMED